MPPECRRKLAIVHASMGTASACSTSRTNPLKAKPQNEFYDCQRRGMRAQLARPVLIVVGPKSHFMSRSSIRIFSIISSRIDEEGGDSARNVAPMTPGRNPENGWRNQRLRSKADQPVSHLPRCESGSSILRSRLHLWIPGKLGVGVYCGASAYCFDLRAAQANVAPVSRAETEAMSKSELPIGVLGTLQLIIRLPTVPQVREKTLVAL
jgi:hypothetical protein